MKWTEMEWDRMDINKMKRNEGLNIRDGKVPKRVRGLVQRKGFVCHDKMKKCAMKWDEIKWNYVTENEMERNEMKWNKIE